MCKGVLSTYKGALSKYNGILSKYKSVPPALPSTYKSRRSLVWVALLGSSRACAIYIPAAPDVQGSRAKSKYVLTCFLAKRRLHEQESSEITGSCQLEIHEVGWRTATHDGVGPHGTNMFWHHEAFLKIFPSFEIRCVGYVTPILPISQFKSHWIYHNFCFALVHVRFTYTRWVDLWF